MSGVEGLFSADWKAREMALTLTSREAISLLLPQLSNPSTGSEVKDTSVHGTCMEVVRHSCGDSVLKVFLASLVSGQGGVGVWLVEGPLCGTSY